MAASFPTEREPCVKKVVELENGVECQRSRGPGILESPLPLVTSPCLTSANMLSFKNFIQEFCALIH